MYYISDGTQETVLSDGIMSPCQLVAVVRWTSVSGWILALKSINQSINQSISQSVNQSINQLWIYIVHKCKASNAPLKTHHSFVANQMSNNYMLITHLFRHSYPEIIACSLFVAVLVKVVVAVTHLDHLKNCHVI